MNIKFLFYFVLLLPLWALPEQGQADTLAIPTSVMKSDLNPSIANFYIVKKGDTLWDISSYFFKDPTKWMHIWEKNLNITNPDLIYPGQKILLSAFLGTHKTKVSRPHPQIHFKPVERMESPFDTSLILSVLERQDFIRPDAVKGMGYILDSPDERINYGMNDQVYLKFIRSVKPGDVFDVFHTGQPLHDPKTGLELGVLVHHLGKIRVISTEKGIAKGVVVKIFEELTRGDRLKPAKPVNTRIIPNYMTSPVEGDILYLRNALRAVGQSQITGISLGEKDGMKAGTVLSIHRAGRMIHDKITDQDVSLPQEKIGDLMVLIPQKNASIALITHSSKAIHLGDAVRNHVK